MSNDWPMVPLSELLTRSEESISIATEVRYRQVTVRLWGHGVVLRNEVNGAEIAAEKRFVIRPQQFIVSRIDARNGAMGIVPDSLDGAVVSSDFPVFTVNRSQLLPTFLEWMSKTSNFVSLCKAASEGTTNRVRLKEDRFLATQVPLPLLDEQRRIVARIEELVAKIEEAQKLRRQTSDDITAFVSSLHLSLAGTRTVRIREILELHECRKDVQFGQKYPQVGIKSFGHGLYAKEAVEATQTTYKTFNRLYEGAVVLSQVKGWEGAISVCRAEFAGMYVSPEYRTFRCMSEMTIPKYLAVLVASPWFWTQLRSLSRGVGARRERTRPEQFLDLELPMPTIDRQKQAVPIFEKVHALKRLQIKTVAELDALLPSVLDKAFKGEL